MHKIRTLLLALLIAACLAPAAQAEDLVLASGAGYKKMVNALSEAYRQKTGNSINLIYGNMARVTTLARQSGEVGLVLGDETFLTKAQLPMVETLELGRGKLVLAFAKSSQFSKVSDLDDPQAGRIALPDTGKAIYGKAAREFLQNSGRLPAIKPRLLEVATIPQVFSYLNTNEVDMGFMNLTHALNVQKQIGGFVILDQDGYSPIRIIVGVLDTCTEKKQADAFLAFLKTPEAKEIVKRHGL
ncbi:MAG: molybdate ABC transporter substrate-binding protein [Desulfovibrionaceae bacterium]|nr:molybdate ABC transporter substrate-binding protein [Desulfovibrionaceae bacterium]